ncbi:histidinol-phosphate transaminase (plasmid) [Pseudoalteromonas xiamenensis]|uniref:histidinol-phosphate transaminase n=1 Tax=Pseudoalteromonas xiamenensis TaxID=882626 RepID=UPI0027E4273A|nr:histidinol-phosphate transaminase [Pseudoalteromonas xiamenensis]WMN62121.1 histidinol-phosphate transaminase [Pseudoalteromonas xiamenensis]
MTAISLPENIENLKAYSSAKSEKIVGSTWLNANESPYAQSFTLTFDDLNRYPDPQPLAVINAYAAYAGLACDQVLMTRGADEGIELLVRTFCEPKRDSITIFTPTYGMYKVTADTHNIAINELSQSDLQSLSAPEIAARSAQSKLVFICNPNNPTGGTILPAKIAEIATALADTAIVVVDEAYIEFSDALTSCQLINDFSNLVILRTLSKAFAMAGLRTGFTLAQAKTLAPIRKVIAPYPVSTVVASLAARVLSPDSITQMKRQVTILNSAKAKLVGWLNNSNAILTVLEGHGNFVTLKLADVTAYEAAKTAGLIMRPFTLYGESDWLRISIGSESELDNVKLWLDSIAAKGTK